ncbi:RNA methyltransferase [Thalassotalea marina]|uniref:tRNA/rRNA methyltransferase SpoU type domain-containing protein n=1 Tax=Thalassotalea marina TaxID=1673741 RepID=A0A919BJZ5_9GAMM|nr:RNA methyltransferase [Thalassotalea marina]GHF96240.1 hypothetical protein GCM10017161_25740 [Thalassotalea marina]
MARVKRIEKDFGFFGIGILNNVSEHNIGTLWRSAYILGASFIFTIDKKYKPCGADVATAWTKIPLYHYKDFEDFKANLPYSTKIVALEMGERSVEIEHYQHPDRAVYLLGNEQSGLPAHITEQCHDVVKLPGDFSLNVSVAGSIVMYDRIQKSK